MTHPTFVLFTLLALASCMPAGERAAAPADPTPDIIALRARIVQAVAQKDRAALTPLFLEDFTHTHAVGRMDNLQQRLESLLSDSPTVESVAAAEVRIRAYGPDRATAIAVGRSTVGDFEYRWTVTYIKGPEGWRVAASHASEVQ
jgi:Domain of unknown function (DUF4440)